MSEEPAAKRQKVDEQQPQQQPGDARDTNRGTAPVKKEFIIAREDSKVDPTEVYNDEDEGRQQKQHSEPRSKKDRNDRKKRGGQNKDRNLKQAKETVQLCDNIKTSGDPSQCRFGDDCRKVHDIEKYLASKPQDVDGVCPVFDAIGYCPSGLKCRWLKSHYENGKLVEKEERDTSSYELNRVVADTQHDLQRKKYVFKRAEKMIEYLDSLKDNNAAHVETPFKPLEKKKLHYNRAKILSPLTTVGNLPYRRLMKDLGADVTFSEMALGLPLIQGARSEWALPRAHSSEKGGFAVQIAGSKYWQTTKAAEVISELCPDVSEMNLNCGCPIDLLFKQGAGSALMDNPSRLCKMLKGMNYVSNDIPVTVKIRTGVKDKTPTAKNLVSRLMQEGQVAAITLHGRSRAQRYTKLADWEYISQVANQVKEAREQLDDDVVKPWIIGNGDVYSYVDWYNAVEVSGCDSVMVARGALIKPWIFEEIDARQHLDKSASERLEIIGKFAKYGLDHWGSDEYGVNTTRRFMCEWLSFTHRYIPEGILEVLPPKINDRPPPFVGRNELETLLASSDYRDWIKITEMFLGKANEGFEFTPKHKSNAYTN